MRERIRQLGFSTSVNLSVGEGVFLCRNVGCLCERKLTDRWATQDKRCC